MNLIDTQLIIHNDCKLTALHENFTDINPDISSKYVSIEFLKYKNEYLYDSFIKKTDMNSSSMFALLKDGVYEYNLYLLPTLEYLLVDTEVYDVDNNMLYNEICLSDKYFYYNNNIYYINIEDLNIDEFLTADVFLHKYIDYILKKSTIASIEYLSEHTELDNQTFFCKKVVLTYCNLTKCFVSLQANIAHELCDSGCNQSNIENRDFLLSTIFVLDYLRDTNNFKEAQRILDNINECGGFCESETLTKCNCCG